MYRKVITFADDVDEFRAVKKRTTCEELKENLVRWGNKLAVEILFE